MSHNSTFKRICVCEECGKIKKPEYLIYLEKITNFICKDCCFEQLKKSEKLREELSTLFTEKKNLVQDLYNI